MLDNATLVLICGNDPHIFECLNSIDIDLPVIVSLAPHTQLISKIKTYKVHVVVNHENDAGNYSIACNRGLSKVLTPKAIIADSDCTFEKGCLQRLISDLDQHPITRAKIIFKSSPHVIASNWIAKLRDSVNNRQPLPAYTPGLGIQMNIVSVIGGYFFDERIFWGGDSEFNHRIQKAGLDIGFDPNAKLFHEPISLVHEIRSGYKFGKGNWVQYKIGIRPPYETPIWLLRRMFHKIRTQSKDVKQDNAAWQINWLRFLWTCAYYFGFYTASLRMK
jgi:glycosyltransferase involved in cell wall biosynthesis